MTNHIKKPNGTNESYLSYQNTIMQCIVPWLKKKYIWAFINYENDCIVHFKVTISFVGWLEDFSKETKINSVFPSYF